MFDLNLLTLLQLKSKVFLQGKYERFTSKKLIFVKEVSSVFSTLTTRKNC